MTQTDSTQRRKGAKTQRELKIIAFFASFAPLRLCVRSLFATSAPATGGGLRLCVKILPVCALLLSACTDVRPTLKIGVLAPFEGLHRRSGYAALEAVRAAIADFPYAQAGILPLALDDSGQPQGAQRSAQKLLVDPQVAAVVGPLSPALSAAAAPVIEGTAIPWFTPHALAGEQWAEGLAAAAGTLAVQEGARGLVLAGWTEGWPALDADAWSQAAGLPVRLLDDPGGVRGDEAVFWLGSAEEGAAYLAQLRRVQPQVPFVLGPAGEDPVFAERAEGFQHTYWTTWTDADYNAWAARHANDSPNAYLVYRATLAALTAATGVTQNAAPASWSVQMFRYDAQGGWSPVQP
jgi:branched-chain amino acid transport system substrate-binding protein